MNSSIKLLTYINKLIKVQKNTISFYGRKMLSDNTKALLDFIIHNGYNKKYRINIIVSDKHLARNYESIYNTSIVTSPVKSVFTMLKSQVIFHSHGMTKCSFIPKKNQIVFNLWHGSPLKSIGILAGADLHSETDTYFLCASPMFADINKRCFNLKDSQIFIGSNPRNQLLYNKPTKIKSIFGDKRLITFLPTFRNSNKLNRIDSDISFPLIDSSNIEIINQQLKKLNISLIIKPHPYQNKISISSFDYENITIITDSDLDKMGISLYELLGYSVALISDYSSVYFDYLLLDRPIAFVIEDFEKYKSRRGFTVENPIEYMPGPKIKDTEDLIQFLEDCNNGIDTYKQERDKINKMANSYSGINACERILEHLGINK